jgi:hypothetical protein
MVKWPILTFIALYSTLIPIFAGIFRFHVKRGDNSILVLFLFSTFSIDCISYYFIKDYAVNLGLMHLYVFLEFLFPMLIVTIWQESPKTMKIFKYIYMLYILFWIIAKLSFEPISGIYSITATTEQVILVLAAGYTLFVVTGNRVQPLFSYSRFWMLLSFVLYYAGTLVIVALQGILVNYSKEDIFFAASILWSLKILFNILIFIGFLCPQTQQQS